MEPYKNKRPRYVRQWYLKLRDRMKSIIAKEGRQALDLSLTNEERKQKHE